MTRAHDFVAYVVTIQESGGSSCEFLK